MHVPNVCRNNGEFILHHHDTKFYKSIKLPNDLQCVLISTNSKEDHTASIALSIRAGSFDDPGEYEGLAHLMSNLIIRETKFSENSEEIVQDEDEIEEKVIGGTTRVKRTRSNKMGLTKKAAKEDRTVEQAPRLKLINGLMYQLNAVKGTIKLITEFEFTTFQIDLPTENLKSILDDFYLRFKCQPTFSEYLINETLKLLRQDYFQKVKENQMMRLKTLLCNLVEDDKLKNYPSNPFLEIKSEEDADRLRERLLDFFRTFYQANRMKLILKSNLSIESMERLLNESFRNLRIHQHTELIEGEQVKSRMNKVFVGKENQNMFYIKPHNKNLNIVDFIPIRQDLMVNLDNFEEHNLTEQLAERLVEENGLDTIISHKISYDNNNLIFNYTSQRPIQSKEYEKNANQLCFIFQVPYSKNYYPIMPLHFISSLICKDGPGTLISYLRKRDLMIKIKSGNLNDCNFSNNSLWNLFFIKIYLTKKGLLMINETIKFLHSYLGMLMKLENLGSLFKEYCKLMLFDYNFKEIRSQSSHDLFVTVKKMHLLPIKHLFVANRIPLCRGLDDNLQVVKHLMRHIKLENSIVAILTDETSFDQVDAIVETFKGVDLKKMSIDRLAFRGGDLFKVEDFPKKNLFLKDNLKINLEPKVYYVPEQINENANAKLWYKKECSELLSLTSVNLLVLNGEFRKNSKLASICDLVLVISEMQTQELLFQIREAGFLYRIEFNRFGFNMSATGNDEVNNVFKKILAYFKCTITEDMLARAKKIVSRNYANALLNKLTVYLDLQNSLLFENQFTIHQRKAEVEHVTLKDVNRMTQMILNESRREYLIQGNYTVKDANKFFTEIERMFGDAVTQEKVQVKHTTRPNQTYNVNDVSDTSETSSSSDQTGSANCTNELLPERSTEHYCLVQLIDDSSESDGSNAANMNEIDQSLSCDTPNSSYAFKTELGDSRRYIESTCLKPGPNRKLFAMDTNNASKIERTSNRTRSHSLVSSVCTDITNVNYNLSPLNNSNNDSKNFSAISQETQIVSNLYFTKYDGDDVQHLILLRILVELIKQNMNGFFTNEQNLRDDFFQAGQSDKNSYTPEITFQDHIAIDGPIQCAEFEMTNSKESFLGDFMIERVIKTLTQEHYNAIIEPMMDQFNQKATWSQDVKHNWNEIMAGKRRFDLKCKLKNALKTEINLNFFKRWAQGILAKMDNYSKLCIQFPKDEQRFDSNSGDKLKLKFFTPHLPKHFQSYIRAIAINDLAIFKETFK